MSNQIHQAFYCSASLVEGKMVHFTLSMQFPSIKVLGHLPLAASNGTSYQLLSIATSPNGCLSSFLEFSARPSLEFLFFP